MQPGLAGDELGMEGDGQEVALLDGDGVTAALGQDGHLGAVGRDPGCADGRASAFQMPRGRVAREPGQVQLPSIPSTAQNVQGRPPHISLY